jgi:hypothetical protein
MIVIRGRRGDRALLSTRTHSEADKLEAEILYFEVMVTSLVAAKYINILGYGCNSS